MRNCIAYLTCLAVTVTAGCGVDQSAQAATVETGKARAVPWSGYWWPMHQGGLIAPLTAYDRLTGHTAVPWERKNRPSGTEVKPWFGFCHAWSASSVMEKEPQKVRAVTSEGRTSQATVGDQKGWLAACHTQDAAHVYGHRFGSGPGSDDPQDIYPDQLWRVLKLYVKEQGVPLVLDLEAGPEVWNYPVSAYEVRYDAPDASGRCQGRLTLLVADDAVAPDYVGTRLLRHTYQFTFLLRDGAVVLGTGRWVGASQKDHPDFAWYPYVAVAENPEVKYDKVQKMVYGSAATPGSTSPGPSTSPTIPGPITPSPDIVQSPATQAEPLLLSPIELVALIADKRSSFHFDVTVDRFDGGHYQPGETFTVRGSSEKAGYLYLLHIDSRAELSLLYPLPGQDNRIPARESFELPRKADRFAFRVTPPPGINRIKALVTSRPLVLTGLQSTAPAAQQQAAAGPAQQQTAPAPQHQAATPLQHQATASTQKRPTPASQQQGAASAQQSVPASQQQTVTPAQQQAVPGSQQQTAKQSQQPVQARQFFRWHPTQRQLIEGLLAQYQKNNTLPLDQVDRIDPRTMLGPFAQDEVLLYVEPEETAENQQTPVRQGQDRPR